MKHVSLHQHIEKKVTAHSLLHKPHKKHVSHFQTICVKCLRMIGDACCDTFCVPKEPN